MLHHTEGDLGDRIEEYSEYVLKEIDIKEIDIEEFILDEDLIEEYEEKYSKSKKYPPIVLDSDYRIIDGSHRFNVLYNLGITKILAFVGIEN